MNTSKPAPIRAMRTVRYFLRHAWRYKVRFIGTTVTMPLAGLALNFIPPLIVADILSDISAGKFVEGDLWASFGGPLALYAMFCFLGGVILYRLAIFFVWSLEMRVLRDIHREVFAHLIDLSATFHANRFAGSLVSQANKLASSYVRFANTMLFELFTLVLSFVLSFIILLPRVPWIAFAILVFSVLYIFITTRMTKKIREARSRQAATETKQTGYLADSVSNVLAVKSFAGGRYENSRYANATAQTMQAEDRVMRISLKNETVFAISTVSIGAVALVMATAAMVLYGADVGTAFLVVTYTGIIGQQLWNFAQHILRDINRAFGDAHEMMEILTLEPEIQDAAKPQKIAITEGAIDFERVGFNHPESDEKDALFRNLDLHVAAGEKVGLVGHSGSGKTTLTKLLLRFNDIDSGRITIDGQDITAITQDELRRAVACVPQEPLLFHRSIRENIAYGKPDATDEEIAAAAKKAHAHEFIQKLAQGYGTLVGERGVKLSGGQRQRIAIARAILKNAPILVLDEATSALDSESERLIQAALRELMKNRTAIVIAHRLSTIQKMDRIVVLDDGTIIEQGTHKELLAKKGAYAKLWKHQSGGFIEE